MLEKFADANFSVQCLFAGYFASLEVGKSKSPAEGALAGKNVTGSQVLDLGLLHSCAQDEVASGGKCDHGGTDHRENLFVDVHCVQVRGLFEL